ncbi:PP2C family protein-serine/threonine phosphatase [Actinomadura hibisca]|uniref:PP2C family protein-serine/threonine phosphatase n=1 Tax=Actinomadura hibisca TaxID=68565 RepID=UPI00083395FA|nr:PP2C family protein-serine/threonine phosphatase [Actinomadura hibisca]
MNPADAALAALTTARRHGVDPADQVPLALALRLALERRPAATPRLVLTGDGRARRLRAFLDEPGAAPGDPVMAVPAPGPDLPGAPPADAAALLDLLADQYDRLREADRTRDGLLETARRDRAAAESARSRLSFLAHAGTVLSASLDQERILGRLHALVRAQRLVEPGFWLAGEGRVLTAYAPPLTVVPAPLRPLTPPPLAQRAFQTGQPHHAGPRPPLEVAALTSVAAPDEMLAVPLASRERVLGVVTYTPSDVPLTADDVAAYIELTRLCAVALDNAMRYRYEHDVAQRLQKAMHTELPTGGRLEYAARYLPAETGLNVGGDWYDAFERPDAHTFAAIGDVAGHGLRAATLMGRLRTALRAYALEAATPGDVLDRMHRLLVHLEPDALATALVMQVTPQGRLRWANAGHPPPLLRAADGRVRTLDGTDPLLGAPADGIEHRVRSTRLEPGDTLLLFTDGLIERRDSSLRAGLRRLARVFSAAGDDLQQAADRVLGDMLTDSAREDDTCLLLAHLPPVPAQRGAPVPEPAAPAARTAGRAAGEAAEEAPCRPAGRTPDGTAPAP